MAEHPGIPADVLALAHAARQRDPVALTALADRLTETGDAAMTREVLAVVVGMDVRGVLLWQFLMDHQAPSHLQNILPWALAVRIVARRPRVYHTDWYSRVRRASLEEVVVDDLLALTPREVCALGGIGPVRFGQLNEVLSMAHLSLSLKRESNGQG